MNRRFFLKSLAATAALPYVPEIVEASGPPLPQGSVFTVSIALDKGKWYMMSARAKMPGHEWGIVEKLFQAEGGEESVSIEFLSDNTVLSHLQIVEAGAPKSSGTFALKGITRYPW